MFWTLKWMRRKLAVSEDVKSLSAAKPFSRATKTACRLPCILPIPVKIPKSPWNWRHVLGCGQIVTQGFQTSQELFLTNCLIIKLHCLGSCLENRLTRPDGTFSWYHQEFSWGVKRFSRTHERISQGQAGSFSGSKRFPNLPKSFLKVNKCFPNLGRSRPES